MKFWRVGMVAGICLLSVTGELFAAPSSAQLLEEGIYAEQIEGDLSKAIGLFDQVIDAEQGQRSHMAQAMYHKGMCYMMLNQEPQAQKTLERLVAEYAEQTRLIERAQKILSDLTVLDPASVMPVDTVLYVELGVTEQQIGELLQMASSMSEDIDLGDKADVLMGTLFNGAAGRVMLAAGLIAPQSGQEEPDVVILAELAESSASWGIIRTALAMAGSPLKSSGSFQLAQIENKIFLAHNQNTLMVASTLPLLEQAIARYQGNGIADSLAAKADFMAHAEKQRRHDNLLSCWLDADGGYADVQKLTKPGQMDGQLLKMNTLVNLEGIEGLLLEFNLEEEQIVVDLNAHLKEGFDAPIYQLLKTPRLSKSGFSAVPKEAVGLLSLSLTGENLAALELLKPLDGMPLRALLGELADCTEQINLFALSDSDWANDPFAGLGLTISSAEPQRAEAVVTQLVNQVSMLLSTQTAGIELKHQSVDGVQVVALKQAVIGQCVAALDAENSVLESDLFDGDGAMFVEQANKALVLDAAGSVQLLEPLLRMKVLPEHRVELAESLDELEQAVDSTVLQLCTKETNNTFGIQLKILQLPEESELMAAVTEISKVNQKNQRSRQTVRGKKRRAMRRKRSMKNAVVIHKTTAPITVDGSIDQIWNEARRLKLQPSKGTEREASVDFEPSVRVTYDQEYLYLLVEVTDDTVAGTASQFWKNDCIELFIDADHSMPEKYEADDYQCYATWRNGTPYYGEDKHQALDVAEWSMVKTQEGYMAEARLAWKQLKTSPKDGAYIGFEVHVGDVDEGNQREALFSWREHRDRAYTSPSLLGALCLNQKPAAKAAAQE